MTQLVRRAKHRARGLTNRVERGDGVAGSGLAAWDARCSPGDS
jgi:hypothetical protein